jgi:hypothetical protein
MRPLRLALVPLLFLFACHAPSPQAKPAPTVAQAVDAGPPEPSPLEQILLRKSLAEAITFDQPLMDDTNDGQVSKGALLLAAWSTQRLKWGDLDALGETRFAQVKKDPDAHRGQRLCTRGHVVQIEAVKTDAGKLFSGLMIDSSENLTEFVAVHGSGDLVERSWARFCGVVIGKYDYPNSGGGVGHALTLVGMFDLPENRR